MDGKYMPTQASKAKNDAMRPTKLMYLTDDDAETVKVAAVIAKVAALSMEDVDSSVATPTFASCPNSVEPKRQHAMKQEKTVPYGVALFSPKALTTAFAIAGGH